MFIIRRLLWLGPVLLAVTFITFVLMHLVPGGPWDAEKALPPAVVENLNRRYGLDAPYWQQYVNFIWHALQGDLGLSFIRQNQTVTEILLQGLPVTATLAGLALSLALSIGMVLGVLAALRQNTWVDYLSVAFATLGASTPNFVLGIILVLTLSVMLKLVPTSGWGSPQHLLLPTITLSAFPAAYIARITRSSMLDVIRQDYVRTARAKGLPEQLVVTRHILKNALIPVLTVAGPIAANLVTGSFVIETLFAIPGVGRLFVQSVLARDYGLIMGAVVFYTVVISLANLVVDILYALVDPRIRY
ncbi:MAG TPA: ABC transporter permease [Dehalococcoidia bacterium]|nr:ABC transporter permease [Dehalococcoidia bacterium]